LNSTPSSQGRRVLLTTAAGGSVSVFTALAFGARVYTMPSDCGLAPRSRPSTPSIDPPRGSFLALHPIDRIP
jgi:hypothetical protein